MDLSLAHLVLSQLVFLLSHQPALLEHLVVLLGYHLPVDLSLAHLVLSQLVLLVVPLVSRQVDLLGDLLVALWVISLVIPMGLLHWRKSNKSPCRRVETTP